LRPGWNAIRSDGGLVSSHTAWLTRHKILFSACPNFFPLSVLLKECAIAEIGLYHMSEQVTQIDWSHISSMLDRDAKSDSRLNRTLKSPLRTAAVLALRKFGKPRDVAASLVWGDTFHGALPEAVSSVIWRLGHYEPVTTQLVISMLKPGDIFVDIGSHFGYFTLLASRLVGPTGKVVAIEAMPSTYAMISQNVARNGLKNVELHNCAAFNKTQKLTFRDFGVVHSSLNTAFDVRGALEGKDAGFTEISVNAVPADELLAQYRSRRIAMIKIDAESSEEFVLEGLSETLKHNRPAILLELGGSNTDDASRVGKIVGLLEAAGYKGKTWRDGRFEAMLSINNLPYDNYIFVHDQRD
jgi:FkbM family methyltransferase